MPRYLFVNLPLLTVVMALFMPLVAWGSPTQLTDDLRHFSCTIPDTFQSVPLSQSSGQSLYSVGGSDMQLLSVWRQEDTNALIVIGGGDRTRGKLEEYCVGFQKQLPAAMDVDTDSLGGIISFKGAASVGGVPVKIKGYFFVGASDFVEIICRYPQANADQISPLANDLADSFKFHPGHTYRDTPLWTSNSWTLGGLISVIISIAVFVPILRRLRRQSTLNHAANGGDAAAMRNLALAYETGDGVRRDYNKSFIWYQKAASAGDAAAMNSLGVLFAQGRGAPQDYPQAVSWFRKAADAGNADAMFNLGAAYGNGQGVAQDDAQAAHWFQKAATLGNRDARQALDQLGKT